MCSGPALTHACDVTLWHSSVRLGLPARPSPVRIWRYSRDAPAIPSWMIATLYSQWRPPVRPRHNEILRSRRTCYLVGIRDTSQPSTLLWCDTVENISKHLMKQCSLSLRENFFSQFHCHFQNKLHKFMCNKLKFTNIIIKSHQARYFPLSIVHGIYRIRKSHVD